MNLRRAQAYSVVGRAVECMRREEPRGKDATRRRQRGRTGRLRRTNYGGHFPRPSTAVYVSRLPDPLSPPFFNLTLYRYLYSIRYESFIPRRNHGRSRRMTSKLCGICDANTRRGSAQLLHKSACQFVAAILRYQRPSGAPASRFFVENGDASRGRET